MALPPHHNPEFSPIRRERLPECLQPLASHIYISEAYSPGPPGQALTTAIELYFDLTSDDLPVQEQQRWQAILKTSGDLRIASSEHRSQYANMQAVLSQIADRISNKPKTDS